MIRRNLFFRLFLILLLVCATAGHAQETTGSDDNLADRLAQFDRDIEKLKNEVDDLGREINNAIAEGQEEWARFANGGLLPGFSERLQAQLPWFELQLGTGFGGSHDRSCSNTYGATLEVPFGSYEGNQILNLSDTTVNPPVPPVGSDFNRTLTALGGAWSFEPGGMLIRMVELMNADVTVTPEPRQFVDCKTTIRYRYVGARGDYTFTKRGVDDEVCSFRVDNSSDPKSCGTGFFGGARYPAPCPRGAQYWSTQGQVSLDMSNESAPRLLFPDGTVEVMGRKRTDWPDFVLPPFFPAVTLPFYAHHQSLYTGGFSYSAFSKEAYWTTDRVVDRNGNRTLYEYDAQNGWVSGVVDPRGRRTSYSRDGRGYVTAISQPGFGGTPLTWTLTWQDFTWTAPNNAFPEINCVANWNPVACPDQAFTTLTRMTLPDGRAYQFSYGPWGNLTQTSSPDGAVTVYEYGDHDSTWFKPPYLNYIDGLGGSHFGDRCPDKMKFILKRRLVRTTVTPAPGAPPQVTSVDHAQEVQLRTTSDPHACYIVQWIHTTRPDGTVRKTGICQGNAAPQGLALGSPPTAIDGRILAEEIWGPGGLAEGTYYGNTGTIGDTSTPIGTMYMDWETPTAATLIPSTVSGNIYDVRPTKVVHIKDGVRWTETFTYDSSDIPANSNQLRTFGNVTSTLTADGLGSALRRVDTSYVTDPAYVAKNLIRLPDTVTIREGGGRAVTRTRYLYDQFPLMATGAPNLEDPGAQRGNVTTTTAYKDPRAPSGEVNTTVRYHDTGEPRLTTDPRGAQTTTAHPAGDFAECSVQPQDTLTATNALGHTASTVSDCWTGLPLTVTDANGQITRTAYDRLSRVTTVTSPGDPTPTQWFEYYYLGSTDNTGGAAVSDIRNQRTVAHTKDGSPDGLTVKTFLDGLGRTVQTRTEVDPATSGGFAEAVTTVEYDTMGRLFRSHVPCFAAASNAVTPSCTNRMAETLYDALGRATRVTPPGLPAVTTQYGVSGTLWTATTTNGRGFQTRTFTDALGRATKTSRQWTGCPGGWCDTAMTYDAAGRLLSVADPAGNTMTMTYDGLGRKLTMTDPDMGGFAGRSWSYQYDDGGNLTSQTDAKGQTITSQYDLLNRITLRDLPPAGPGEEDVTVHYDGLLPATCYSCDDRCATTTDSCDTASLTCRHTGTPCDGSTPPPTCTYAIAPTSTTAASGGGTGSVSVTTTAGCAWTATSDVSWLTVTAGASGTGNGTVSYSVAANTGAARTGHLTIGGQTFTVSQDAATCTFTFTPPSASVGSGAGSYSVAVATGCAWTATSNATWITVTSGASGTDNGTVGYSVTANTGTKARTGQIIIGSQLFQVTQAAPGTTCTYSISPTSQSFSSTAGSGSVSVTAGAGCAWTAVSNAAWITVTGGSSGSGNGTVSYSVANNASSGPRTGTVAIAGQTFTAIQAGSAAAPPTAPSGTTATVLSSSQIRVDWTDNSADETGFSIERKTGTAGTWAAVGSVAANATTYTDSGLASGTAYFYRVRSTNSAGLSAPSNEASATTTGTGGTPAPPSLFTATGSANFIEVELSWQDNSNNETTFRVERSSSGSAFAEIIALPADTTFYTDINVNPFTTYTYRVRACNASGCSAYSNSDSGTPGTGD